LRKKQKEGMFTDEKQERKNERTQTTKGYRKNIFEGERKERKPTGKERILVRKKERLLKKEGILISKGKKER
jgi:hypothetical protein